MRYNTQNSEEYEDKYYVKQYRDESVRKTGYDTEPPIKDDKDRWES